MNPPTAVDMVKNGIITGRVMEREEIIEMLKKFNPLHVATEWKDSDKIAYAIRNEIIKLIKRRKK